MNITNQFTLAAAVLLFCSCSSGVTIKTGDLRLRVDDRMQLSLQSDLARTPLVEANSTFSELCLEDGRELEYRLEDVSKSSVEDNFGKGVRYTVTGTAIAEDVRIEKRYVFSLYEQFPSFIVSKVEYRNLSDSPIGVKGWKSDIFKVIYPEGLPCVWSFQGQSTESREDWIIPVKEEFYQKNYQGMNDSDYGGGIPVTVLWRPDAGLMVGHIEPCPQQVSLPVVRHKGDDGIGICVDKEYVEKVELAADGTLSTFTTFVGTFRGDCFSPLRTYSGLLEKVGVVMPESEDLAFEPSWCAWGYARKFTIDEILGTLPKVKELGFRWATLDDGYQIAEGDWDLTRERFPNGDADMKMIVDEIHRYGLKAELWWCPLAADPGTAFLRRHPDALILNKDGKPQDITWWDSWYLSPLDEDVRKETVSLVKRFMDYYGYDGLKLDGQHMNAVPSDYNPAHHPDDPEKCARELPGFFKLIWDTARDIKKDAVIQYCPCGDCFSVYHLPYTNKTVSSDPESSWQIRTKGYVLRALAPKTAYYGDHIELSDGRNDYPTQLGIGAVLGTKFTWPNDNPYVRNREKCLLTPEKEALLKNALEIYNEKMLSKGEYVSGIYDIGYDYPETHLIAKDGKFYYAFYATRGAVPSVELRGLEKGRTYKVTDYYNHVDLGEVTASDRTMLNVPVEKSLLIEVAAVESHNQH